MFAHYSAVGAAALHGDVVRQGEQALVMVGHDGHYAFGKSATEQVENRSDLAGTTVLDVFPCFPWKWLDGDFYRVEFGANNHGIDFTLGDVQMAHRFVAHVRAAAWQAILEVAERFEVIAPGFAPKCVRDFFLLHFDGLDVKPLLAKFLHLAHGVRTACCDGHVWFPSVVATHYSAPTSLRDSDQGLRCRSAD